MALCGVKGYCHTNFTHIQAMGHQQAATADRDIPIVAKMEVFVE
jgi:hypothetical protein